MQLTVEVANKHFPTEKYGRTHEGIVFWKVVRVVGAEEVAAVLFVGSPLRQARVRRLVLENPRS